MTSLFLFNDAEVNNILNQQCWSVLLQPKFALFTHRVDQNTGGALLEFPVRTAIHGESRVSSAIKYDFLSWTALGIV